MDRLRVFAALGVIVILMAAGGWGLWRIRSSAQPEEAARLILPTIRPEDDITRYSHYSAPGMAQAQIGKSVYDDWCIACHADTGLGLTADWLGQWDSEHQNCWQAKCHSVDHPSDGFVIPRFVPAVVGPESLGGFATAADLHQYIKTEMPYSEMGMLDDQMYWALTAYLLQRNALPGLDGELGPFNARSISLDR
jgi:cytochrome c